jgi:hypothetical protein
MRAVPVKLSLVVLVAVCTAAFAAPVQARQDVRVSFANGRVTVIAENATLTAILREWQRVGGSTFINLEKISSNEPVTLHLENAPELQAIDVLLRPTAGYIVAGRTASSTSPSSLGRVLLMSGRRPATYPAAVATSGPATPTVEETRPRFPAGPPRPDDDGPVRRQTPPAPATQPPAALSQPATLGQASPLQNTSTSAQPGATIGGAPSRPPTPTQPKPGGGGG